MPRRSRGFAPIAAPDARVLILGSLPGQVSLAHRQYYAQPHNAFWRIMGALFDAGPEWPYEERAARLEARGVALWDVCRAAVRPGSLDSAIDLRSVLPNDFRTFFRTHGAITAVFTNGGTATRLYTRCVLPGLAEPARSLPLHPLPSTSPAHASLRFDQKLARWQVVATAAAGAGQPDAAGARRG